MENNTQRTGPILYRSNFRKHDGKILPNGTPHPVNLNYEDLRFDYEDPQAIRVDLSDRDFSGADLENAVFGYGVAAAVGTGAILCRTNFENALLTNSNFCECDLQGAIFINADCENTNMFGVDARDAIFTNAFLKNGFLECAEIQGADFSNVDLSSVKLTYVTYDDNTILTNLQKRLIIVENQNELMSRLKAIIGGFETFLAPTDYPNQQITYQHYLERYNNLFPSIDRAVENHIENYGNVDYELDCWLDRFLENIFNYFQEFTVPNSILLQTSQQVSNFTINHTTHYGN